MSRNQSIDSKSKVNIKFNVFNSVLRVSLSLLHLIQGLTVRQFSDAFDERISHFDILQPGEFSKKKKKKKTRTAILVSIACMHMETVQNAINKGLIIYRNTCQDCI